MSTTYKGFRTNRQHDEDNDAAIAAGERRYAESFEVVGDSYDESAEYGCECEMDWTCPPCKAKGRFGGYTYMETRFDGLYDDPRGE